MSVRDVADMLAVAHAGRVEAANTNDDELRVASERLAALALAHADAGTFFTGLQLALAETYDASSMDDPFDPLEREKPRVHEDDPMPSRGDIRTGVVATHAPVDASALPHDGLVTKKDREHRDRIAPAIAGLVVHASANDDLRARAARNLA